MKLNTTLRTTLSVLMTLATLAMAGTIGYVEDFSLAKDRNAALKQLIPGTQDYYYYHCLHHLNTGQPEKIAPLFKLWVKRYGETSQYWEIRNRLMLLSYDKDPKPALAYLRWRLGLSFNHQREELNKKLTLPTTLKQSLIRFDVLAKRAFSHYTSSTSGFNASAHYWLAQQTLSGERRRDLVRKLTRPDLPNLVKLVLDDLNYKHSGGFGSMTIHRQMTRAQLDELLAAKPDLKNQNNFVYAYLTKLAPNPDEDRQFDTAVITAHLDRLWAYVSTLSPVHNSLKACVLYHRLVLDRNMGKPSRERFQAYIQLPRNASYVNPKYYAGLYKANRSLRTISFSSNFKKQTSLSPIGNDSALIRSYLLKFFLEDKTWNQKKYTEFLSDTFLKQTFAEVKILAGLGDMEQWYSYLSPSQYKALKQRVDIDFAATNAKVFAPADKVHLDLSIKNVKKLIVKVFEIDELNYYRANGKQIDTQINLDGLVANYEKTYDYTEPDLRRVKRGFDLPQCNKRGVYVVEFIGNGKSSRAIVRKGKLNFLARTSSAGQVLTVLNEANKKVSDATAYVGGHEYNPGDDGTIYIPYSTSPGSQKIILQAGDFASLTNFEHLGESYYFHAGIHVEREELIKGKTATVVIRPALRVHSRDVSLKLLKEVKLTIDSVDLYGVSTSKVVKDFKLHHDKESTYDFKVPDNLQAIHFRLDATVQNKSKNKKESLSEGHSYFLNQIDTQHKTEDLLMSCTEDGYVIDLLGKTGEDRPARPVTLYLKHRDFKQAINVSLQTDTNGRVHLGALTDIAFLMATSPEGTKHMWTLPKDGRTPMNTVNGVAGKSVFIPYMGTATKISPEHFSLLETRGTFVKDWTTSLKLDKGFIVIHDLPAGDYELHLRKTNQTVTVRLAAGKAGHGYAMSTVRQLELLNTHPLQITDVTTTKKNVKIQLLGAGKFARVHVAAVRYAPAYSLSNDMAISMDGPLRVTTSKDDSQYVAGRDIGDEYRYILDRQIGMKFPGNMLKRPGLLLNPWAISDTSTGQQHAGAPSVYERTSGGGGPRGSFMGTGGSRWDGTDPYGKFTTLDFLATPSVLLKNLRADKDGVVTIARKDLAGHQDIRILAVDPQNTVWRQVALEETALKITDQRFLRPFDTKRHFTQQRKITAVAKGETLTIDDIASSRFDAYDSLPRVFGLYSTLSNNATLREFAFVIAWPTLKDERKRELYSKYACHELNFFLYKKDAKFFETVVQPSLANKKDKTFMDRYLLGEDLATYLKPWNHAQLNIVERILLAKRFDKEQAVTARAVKDLYDLIPPNLDRYNHLFQTALKGNALDQDGKFNEAKKAALVRYSYAGRVPDFSGPRVDLGAVGGTSAGRPMEVGGMVMADAVMPKPSAPAMAAELNGRREKTHDALRAVRMQKQEVSEMRKALSSRTLQNRQTKIKHLTSQALSLRSNRKYVETLQVVEEILKLDPNNEWARDNSSTLRNYIILKASGRNQNELKRQEVKWYQELRYPRNWKELSKTREGLNEELALQAADVDKRESIRQLYRMLGVTKEWVENNYYHLPIQSQTAALVSTNGFWADYAAHSTGAFVTKNLAEAHRSFTEMMFALAVLDLPVEAEKHTTVAKDGAFSFTAGSETVAIHEEIKPAAAATETLPILVSQNFFRYGDRYTYKNNIKHDKYVTDEFLTGVVYGCHVVVTNPTSTRQQLQVLLQIPAGAICVASGKPTRSVRVDLQPYRTSTMEYSFYFPVVGQFPHYPTHIAKDEKHVAAAPIVTLNVVKKLSKIDKSSWDYISQFGTGDEVMTYLKLHNLNRLNLAKIAWRVKDKDYFRRTIAILNARHIYNTTLYSYGIFHNDVAAIREFMQHQTRFVSQCGYALKSTLLTIDPVARKTYQHMEYLPLVNARAHQLGRDRKIVNERFFQQYNRLLTVLRYRKTLDDAEKMAVVYYLLLQDRVEEGLAWFAQIDPKNLETTLQYDYFKVYTSFYTGQVDAARTIATKHKDHPVDKWRKVFTAALTQLDEIAGKSAKVVDKTDRGQQQTALADTAPSLTFKVEDRTVTMNYQNLKAVTVNYYKMNIELLFSRNPFVQSQSATGSQFSYIKPNASVVVKLDPAKKAHTFALPKEFENANVLIDIAGAGVKQSKTYYANSMAVQMIETYGQVKVADAKTAKPLAKTYVKVYAKMNNGQIKFFKDGYTDLRGRFDYTSLNTTELNQVQKFALLIFSDTHGAVIREATPPKR